MNIGGLFPFLNLGAASPLLHTLKSDKGFLDAIKPLTAAGPLEGIGKAAPYIRPGSLILPAVGGTLFGLSTSNAFGPALRGPKEDLPQNLLLGLLRILTAVGGL